MPPGVLRNTGMTDTTVLGIDHVKRKKTRTIRVSNVIGIISGTPPAGYANPMAWVITGNL